MFFDNTKRLLTILFLASLVACQTTMVGGDEESSLEISHEILKNELLPGAVGFEDFEDDYLDRHFAPGVYEAHSRVAEGILTIEPKEGLHAFSINYSQGIDSVAFRIMPLNGLRVELITTPRAPVPLYQIFLSQRGTNVLKTKEAPPDNLFYDTDSVAGRWVFLEIRKNDDRYIVLTDGKQIAEMDVSGEALKNLRFYFWEEEYRAIALDYFIIR